MIIVYYIIRLYFMTIRIEPVNETPAVQHLQKGGRIIAALWHQRIISIISYARLFGNYRPSVMISASRDGDLIADVFSRMNFRPVRGSSSRGGKKALMTLVDDLKNNPIAVQILDGPKGPRGKIKPGLIVLAKQSGVPIVPLYVSVSRALVLKSWDRCIVPMPFSKIVIRWDEQIAVPRDIDEQTFEEFRMKLEKRMLENQRSDDGLLGWKNLI